MLCIYRTFTEIMAYYSAWCILGHFINVRKNKHVVTLVVQLLHNA
jgi:hypothetical protein